MLKLKSLLEKTDIFKELNIFEKENGYIVIDFLTKTIDNEYTVDFKAFYNKNDDSNFEIKIIKNYK